MSIHEDPKRYFDPGYRAKARNAATFLGEPGASELRAALDTIESQAATIAKLGGDEPTDADHYRYAIDALLTDLDKFFKNPDPAEGYEKLCEVEEALRELVKGG